MSDQISKSIRSSETVSPYGPGAIVDILGQSFMVPTGDKWPPARLREEVHHDRLAARLNVQELWAAPTTADPESSKVPGLEFRRFPGWLFCQVCRRMVKWTISMETGKAPVCPDDSCDGRLVPMRFVAVCTENSHLTDVPWSYWMHRDAQGDCRAEDRLTFRTSTGRAEGLSSLVVTCGSCGHSRSLGDLRRDVFAAEGITCNGTQPWESSWGQCGKPLDPQQRGATSLHFAETFSAIDIPVVEGRAVKRADDIKAHVFFAALQSAPEHLREGLATQIAEDIGVDVTDVFDVAGVEEAGPVDRRAVNSSLQAEEFEAFLAAIDGTAPTVAFKTRVEALPVGQDPVTDALVSRISDVVLVDRLRDVRANIGFRRYRPDAALVEAVPAAPYDKRWLPAVEGYGEGIFLRLAPDAVGDWAATPAVKDRADVLVRNQRVSVLGARLHVASAEYVLLHTFAHSLMRMLAFTSGYPAASLRERVYCEADGDYGVFIYTTTTDVEGTLGGLVRQGEADQLIPAVLSALQEASFCPNDPVCAESQPQSIDGLNQAACHACCLASETSCESQNLLLDRVMLVGGEGVPGFFGPVLERILGRQV